MPILKLAQAGQSINSVFAAGEPTKSIIPPSTQHYDLSNMTASTGGDPSQGFDTSKWTSQMGGNHYFPQNEGHLPVIRPIGGSPSTNQEDMVDYLAEMIPDIWMAEIGPSLSLMQDSIMQHSHHESVPLPTDELGSSILTEDYSTSQVSTSANDVTVVVQASDATDSHQAHYRLDIPTFVVDDLYGYLPPRLSLNLNLIYLGSICSLRG